MARLDSTCRGEYSAAMPSPRYWLMKSEPTAFSFGDLVKSKNSTNHWDGVRNYQARNFMREMRAGDQVLFYHSNCDPTAVVGLAKVVREAYPDHTQFDPKNIHYDPKATPEKPIWDMVDVRAIKPLRSEEHTSELQSQSNLVCRLLLEKKKKRK